MEAGDVFDKIKHFIDMGQICIFNFKTSLLIQERYMTCVIFYKSSAGKSKHILLKCSPCNALDVLHVGFMKYFC